MDIVMQASIHNSMDHLLLLLPHNIPVTIPAIAYMEKGVGKYLCIFSYLFKTRFSSWRKIGETNTM